MPLSGKIALYCILSILFLTSSLIPQDSHGGFSPPRYHLAVSFDLEKKMLIGTAHATITSGEKHSFHTGSLKITGILIKKQDGSVHETTPVTGKIITIAPDPSHSEVFISYTKEVTRPGSNLISDHGITLLEDWYPIPEKVMNYQLDAILPKGFKAITESDTFPLTKIGDTVSATFSQPTHALHFAAAPYSIFSQKVREGLQVYTMFFPEDTHLAPGYLEKAVEYISRYEQEIGVFPYNHYVIVANRLPTGLGMPTFTLLGQSVLRLPFIKDTSLGHEILHSWFGNSIDVDVSSGNWCEGLTAYLADHAYRNDKGEGPDYRKEAIVNYLSYVNNDNVQPLSNFSNASHNQPLAKPLRAIGYSRGLLLFHELRTLLGDDNFADGIRTFYQKFRGQTASWKDIEEVFSKISGQDLAFFFTDRLTRKDIPDISVQDIDVSYSNGKSLLSFSITQNTDQPYSLAVPISVKTGSGVFNFIQKVDKLNEDIILNLPGRPLQFSLDPEYSMLRNLEPDEFPASWSRFMGSKSKLVLLESEVLEDVKIFQPLLEILQDDSWKIANGNQISNTELQDADLLILGINQPAAKTLFGTPDHAPTEFTLDVRNNPLNPDHVAVLVSSNDESETRAIASRLSHYGKYDSLHFSSGRLTGKSIDRTDNGIIFILEDLPAGGSTAQLTDFKTIVEKLSQNDVIYIGETHDAVSDHRLQLRIVEALLEKHPDLAIGMEMFPASSQKALDAYTLGDGSMSEKEFLKASRYFEVWRYDFRFFQELFHVARINKIPVIGLNLERSIVSTVYRTGSTDDLSNEIKNSIPPERDLDLPGYTKRLRNMHSLHQQGNHGSGISSGFIQAQALWDETMAENIASHLKKHPGRKMVVIAGAQHTRKDSGIPPRVARRIDVSQASVLNILNGSTPTELAAIADYFFLTAPIEIEPAPKLGIVLQEQTSTERKYVEISEFNAHSKADEAGLQEGDIFVSIQGIPIATIEDIRIAMFDLQPGEKVQVRVERRENEQKVLHTLQVETITITGDKPHP